MTDLDKNDYSSPNVPKEQTRRDNLSVAKASPFLWSQRRGCLRVDWLELAGVGAPTLQFLLDEGALGDRRFVGVDREESVLVSCRERYKDVGGAVWRHTKKAEHFIVSGDPVLRDVGVLNFDVFGAPGESWGHALDCAFQFAEGQYKKIGAFLLVLNSTRPRDKTREKNVALLAEILVRRTGRPWKPEDVMTGHYRSEGRVADMFNLHVRFGF